MLTVIILTVIMLTVIMLTVIMLTVIMLTVIMLIVIFLTVVSPFQILSHSNYVSVVTADTSTTAIKNTFKSNLYFSSVMLHDNPIFTGA
jgi:hypothetical protein